MTAGKPLSPETLAVLDDAACGLLQTDADGLVLRVNRPFCNWTGYAHADLAGKRKLQDLLTMGGRIFHQTHWAPLLQIQGSVSEVKLEVVHSDGHAVPMVMNALRRTTGGVVVHEIAAFMARDRDRYERELVQSRRRLETLVAEATRLEAESKDRAVFAEQMMGIVSHDLRNPLSTIQMSVAVLSRGDANPNHQRVLGRISRATERAGRLIGDLLDFTRARLGEGLLVSPSRVDLHAVVAEAVDELGQAYAGRRLRHVREGEGDCSVDPDRLAQLVGNLVSNAMTYGTPEAAVTVLSTVGDSDFTVAVHNEGVPIPTDMLPDLFTPMTRGVTEANPARSIGLGLFIVSEIAKAHKGRVSVSSTAESGTVFSAVFPRTP